MYDFIWGTIIANRDGSVFLCLGIINKWIFSGLLS